MKANKQALRKDEDAQVGIGTMIVFIATILVAAVAAGVLINVSGGLQSKAVATGNDATNNVASTLLIQSVYGQVNNTTIDNVTIYLQLGAGASALEVGETTILFSDGTTLGALKGTGAEVSGDNDTYLESGEIWSLTFDNDGSPLNWAEGTGVELELVPISGSSAKVVFTTPTAYGGNTWLRLF